MYNIFDFFNIVILYCNNICASISKTRINKKKAYDYRTKEKEKTLVYDWEKVCEHELIIFQSYGSM